MASPAALHQASGKRDDNSNHKHHFAETRLQVIALPFCRGLPFSVSRCSAESCKSGASFGSS